MAFFHGNGLYRSIVRAVKPEPELLSHDPDGIPFDRPAGLFQSKGIILPILLEFRRMLSWSGLRFAPVKEGLVASVEPLHDILHSLGAEILPLRILSAAESGDKNLQPIGRNIFAVDTVISLLQGKTVIPNLTGKLNFIVQVFCFLCPIQLILIGTSYR